DERSHLCNNIAKFFDFVREERLAMSDHVLDCPIGELGSVDGWKQLPISECGEQLVPLGAFSNYPQIATDSIYAGERRSSPYPCEQLRSSMFAVFVREGVAERLAKVAELLPSGHMLLVWDAYRPLAVQQALFNYYVGVLEKNGTSHDQAIVDAQRFVSIPSNDPTKPPPHNTGGAVDLTIIRFSEKDWREMERLTVIVRMPETGENWQQIYAAEMERQQLIREASVPLEMGTVFDGVHPETATRFYEELNPTLLDEKRQKCLINRRLFWNVMVAAGFSNYPEEWWHFDFGNQFDAVRTGRQAIYGAATFSKENEDWETMRRGHYFGSVAIAERRHPAEAVNKLGEVNMHEYYPFVRDITMRTGHLKHTVHPQGAAI
ncbi:MAG: M15 family metallopeptidase, partial [Patescibacteria group bacterium]